MNKQDIINNKFMTDAAIAADASIDVNHEMFKSQVTQVEAYQAIYNSTEDAPVEHETPVEPETPVKPDFTSETITLAEDYVATAVTSFNGVHTLDLNGHTVSNETDLYDLNNKVWSLFEVKSGADVTIKGAGKVAAKEDDCYAVDVKGGNLVIEDGEFVGNISAIYVHDGTAVINGGVYKIQQLDPKAPQNGYGYLLNCLDANYKNGTAKLEVRGGEFHGFNPAANVEGVGTSYVAEGYESVELTPGVWTVREIVDPVAPAV